MESTGGEEVIVNLWNFAPSHRPSARFTCAPSTHNLLWLSRPTLLHAIILPWPFACQASDSVATIFHTEWVSLVNHQNHDSSHTHRKTCRKAKPHWEHVTDPALMHEGLPFCPKGEQFFVVFQSLRYPPSTTSLKERENAGASAVSKICGVAPPFHWAGINQGVWRLWG